MDEAGVRFYPTSFLRAEFGERYSIVLDTYGLRKVYMI